MPSSSFPLDGGREMRCVEVEFNPHEKSCEELKHSQNFWACYSNYCSACSMFHQQANTVFFHLNSHNICKFYWLEVVKFFKRWHGWSIETLISWLCLDWPSDLVHQSVIELVIRQDLEISREEKLCCAWPERSEKGPCKNCGAETLWLD